MRRTGQGCERDPHGFCPVRGGCLIVFSSSQRTGQVGPTEPWPNAALCIETELTLAEVWKSKLLESPAYAIAALGVHVTVNSGTLELILTGPTPLFF